MTFAKSDVNDPEFDAMPSSKPDVRSFPDVARRFALKLTKTRSFANGVVFVSYERAS